MATDISEAVLVNLRTAVREADAKAQQLRDLLAAAETILGAADAAPSQTTLPLSRTPRPRRASRNGQRPTVAQAVLRVMREAPTRPWTTPELAAELGRRGWLGGQNGPSKEALRQRLSLLQKEGEISGRKSGSGSFAPVTWSLTDTHRR